MTHSNMSIPSASPWAGPDVAGPRWRPEALRRHASNPAPGGRDLAVGDIHGCYSALRSALERVGFDSSRDRLFCAGDLVDRGPEPMEALAWLAEPWFHSCMGNHDFMAWRAAEGRPYELADYRDHGGDWLDELSDDDRPRVARALRNLPIAMEVETASGPVGFVHADFPYDDWGRAGAMKLVESASSGDLDSCLWGAARFDARYDKPVKGARALIQGHICMRDPLILGNVHYLDTGGWRAGGRFTLLDLDTLKPAAKPHPKARAKARPPSAA